MRQMASLLYQGKHYKGTAKAIGRMSEVLTAWTDEIDKDFEHWQIVADLMAYDLYGKPRQLKMELN